VVSRVRRFERACGLALLLLAAASPAALAASTRIWVVDSAGDFSSGEARGVSVSMDGTLVLSRDSRRVDGISESTLFSAVRDREGDVILGTGNDGKILRVSPAGKVETLATLPSKEVTSLALSPDGVLYAGTAPGGKVYRIEKGKASAWYETKAQYVWALAFSGKTLYVATGLPGEIHRVSAEGKGERVHATRDPHVRSLYADAKGRIWAGTSGSGLVLRIDPSGAVSTVYDSAKSEITSITASRDGRVWVAAGSAEAPSASQEPISAPQPLPAIRPPRQSNAREGDEAQDKPEVTVTVSQPKLAPAKSGARQGGYSSEVLLFEDGEPPRPVWTSPDELVFDLAPDGDAPSVLAGTGPNGKLYRLGSNLWSLERTFDEKQVTALAGNAVATNSASALYRFSDGPRQGEYVSAVKDTGRTSRFGAFRVEGDIPDGSRVELSFRSGEAGLPDATWSDWSPYAALAQTAMISAPPARYLQWKVRMRSDGAKLPAVRRVEAAYRNRNAAPVIDSFIALGPAEVLARSASGGSNVFETTAPDEKGIFTSLDESRSEPPPRRLLRKGYRTLTWKATDADSDTLTYEIEFKPERSAHWLPLKKGLREAFYSFDTAALPDGDYIFRLKASDLESNPEEPKTSARETSPVIVDNTPPIIRRLPGSAQVLEFEAKDALSPILEAEYSVDAKEWVRLEPKDGLADSPTETYQIRLDPKWKGAFLLVRVSDAARNVASASFTP
jgi:sugar lactone lactonase YvrE